MKVGDLVREKQFPEDACGIIVEVGDLRKKKPYKVFCPAWGEALDFEKKYIILFYSGFVTDSLRNFGNDSNRLCFNR